MTKEREAELIRQALERQLAEERALQQRDLRVVEDLRDAVDA